jgi:hypothetical protein
MVPTRIFSFIRSLYSCLHCYRNGAQNSTFLWRTDHWEMNVRLARGLQHFHVHPLVCANWTGRWRITKKMKAISLEEVRRMGIAAAAREALGYASGQGTREFWPGMGALCARRKKTRLKP